jgi:regulator of sigma E protease
MELSIILAILAFSVLIIGHELGHFTLAKINGVKVEEFSIGMGPKLFGVKGKETEYVVKAFPIGGYVRMFGEEEKVSDPRAFSSKSPERKLSIIAAGPLMNLVMAVVFFMIIALAKGFTVPVVNEVQPNTPAQAAGLEKGDKIIRIDNKRITTWEDFVTEIYTAKGRKIDLTYKRNGSTNTVELIPMWNEEQKRFIVGVAGTGVENPGILQSIGYGFNETKSLVRQTFVTFRSLFRGQLSPNDIGGPVTIIKVSGQAAKAGFWNLLWFSAFLSVQLAIFNIIPFPALDGGWIFLLLFEIITRKKVDDKKVAFVNYIGFTVLMMLIVLVTIKDIFFPVKF